MRVLLAGASGAIGVPLLRRLRSAGHDVVALHRASSGAPTLSSLGATPVQVDVLDRDALLRALDGMQADAVIAELTALKKLPMTHRAMAATNRLRTEGTANLVAAAQRLGAQRFITQSMIFGYGFGDLGGRVLAEDDTFGADGGSFTPHLRAMRVNEELVRGCADFAGIALRYGLFYGPAPVLDAIVDGLRRRRMPVVHGGGPLPWVYIDDAATATVAALERGVRGAAYNVVDDDPVSTSTLLTEIAAAVAAPQPRRIPMWTLNVLPYTKPLMRGGLRVDNAKAKRDLGWTPQVPSHREGVPLLAPSYARPGVHAGSPA